MKVDLVKRTPLGFLVSFQELKLLCDSSREPLVSLLDVGPKEIVKVAKKIKSLGII